MFASRFLPRLFVACALAALVLAPVGCSKGKKSESEASKSNKTGETPAGRAGSKNLEKEVHAALDNAIKNLENKKYAEFLSDFMPIEELRRIHRNGGPDVAARLLFRKDEAKKMFIELIQRMRKVKPTFRAAGSVAVFKIVEPEQVVKAKNVALLKERNKSVKVTGYGDDLKGAINKAVADLEKGDIEAYLRNMLPVIELQLNDVKVLAKRIEAGKVNLMDANPRNPLLLKMIADLKATAKGTPKMESEGNIAVFEIPFVPGSSSVGSGSNGKKKPMQVIKFQKEGGHWRLFDNTTALREAAKGMSRKIASSSDELYMEKIGNQWRLATEEPGGEYRSLGKTIRHDYGRTKTESFRYEKTESPRVKQEYKQEFKRDEKTKAEKT